MTGDVHVLAPVACPYCSHVVYLALENFRPGTSQVLLASCSVEEDNGCDQPFVARVQFQEPLTFAYRIEGPKYQPIKAGTEGSRPDPLSQALNEGDGVYRP